MVGEVTCVEVDVDVERLVEVVLLVEEVACELLRCEPAILREGATVFAKSASDIRLIVAQYSCAPFWSDPAGTSNN